VAHCHACHTHIRLVIFCVLTQQTATFLGRGDWGPKGYDPEIRSRARFVYTAPSRQVSSSYVESFGSYRADKHTNKQTPLKTSTSLSYATSVSKHERCFHDESTSKPRQSRANPGPQNLLIGYVQSSQVALVIGYPELSCPATPMFRRQTE